MEKQIIPTILVQTFKEVEEKIRAVEKYVEWVQIDVMDGIFVYNETWPASAKATAGKPAYLRELNKLDKLGSKVKIEVHLMVEYPEKIFDDWLKVADRIIIHFESKITNREFGIREMMEKCHKNKIEFGLALNPETHWAVATPFFPRQGEERGKKNLDLILLMSVQPGWGGQEMKEWVLEKAEALRKRGYKGNIEIDGGVNDENIKKIVKSGINLVCAGTYIFRSKDIKEAINNLIKNAK